ncbi:MAG: hypothetical protein ACI8TP_002186 [Acidimicrobiales bacterium]|jgi:hypothetical protein
MNLFRSEEHARNWSEFDPGMADRMLKPLVGWAEIFSNPFFRQRTRPDYISWTQSDEGQAAFGLLRSSLAG